MLDREEGLLKAIIENAIDGVIVINRRGIIALANDAALGLFGYERQEVVGNNVSMLMGEPDHSNHDYYINQYVETGKKHIIGIGREVVGKKKDGNVFPFRLAISEIRIESEIWFTGFVHDLTRQKETEEKLKNYANNLETEVAKRTFELETTNKRLLDEVDHRILIEDALRNSQELYTVIASNFPNGVINVFDHNLNYVFADGKGFSDVGIDPKTLVGSNFLDQMLPEARNFVSEELSLVSKGEPRVFEIERNNNFYILRAVPLTDARGVVNNILVVETNITPQKQAEVEIYRALQKEKELNEMKSRFVSMASHEFRTPLSTILSSASLIGKYSSTDQDPQRQKHIERIKSNVNNLNMILQDFLSLEKLDEGIIHSNKTTFELCSYLKEICEEIEGILKPGQSIKIECHAEKLEVCLDQHLMRNVLNNLLSNASKYSETGKSIYLKIHQEKELLIFDVCDEGMGIPEKDQPLLFSRFFRAANSGNIPGTGLGLHIVKKYVELMQGEICFESILNKGTTFTLTFDQTKK
jgi:PAS domain S-box-containing protein